MEEDWRFRRSPPVDIGGLRAYAGTPLRFDTEFGDCIAFGSLCVASNNKQEHLSPEQHRALVYLADWIVADIVQSARARRQRERRRMVDLIAMAQKESDAAGSDEGSEEAILRILRETYPDSTITIQSSQVPHIAIDGRDAISPFDLDGGLWEDSDHINFIIETLNHQEPASRRVLRVVVAECENLSTPTYLVVASKDIRLVFDDVDAWFVKTCAATLSRLWQTRQLKEALRAKEQFLRGITHQLRTPIHGILGSVELLAEELEARQVTSPKAVLAAAEERVDPLLYINTIKMSGRDLISTVNSIITLNRWADVTRTQRQDSLHTIKELEKGLLSTMLHAVSEDHRVKSTIFFDYSLPVDCDSVCIDMGLLRDSVLPLVINAVQNTPTGVVVVSVSVTDDYDSLSVDVVDNGCGIRCEDQSRIFEPYEKVDTYTTGAGLGLTLAQKFANLLNGHVALVSSTLHRGSHFRASFRQPTCACSPVAVQTLSKTLKNLPTAFHRVPPPPANSSDLLCDYFIKYLVNNGYTPSDTPRDSFIVLDYVPDLAERLRTLSGIPEDQIAIFLVPSSHAATELDPVPRNVLYLRGPFLSSTLDDALKQADLILSELSSKAGSISLDTSQSSSQENSDDTAVESPSEASSPSEIDTAVITKAIQVLQIDVTPVIPAYTPVIKSPAVALLVDDNAINLRIMQMYCSKRGISYCCATDGQQAVGIMKSRQTSAANGEGDPIELVMMDLQMPVCDGIEATQQIRALEKEHGWKRSTIFIVTGQDSKTDRSDAEAAGADSFFVKPVGIKLLDIGVKTFFPDFKAG